MWQRNSVYLIYIKYYLYYDHYGILGINALSKKFSFLLLTVITMLDGNEEVKLWLACVAGGNVHSRKVLEEDVAKMSENGEEMPPKLSHAKTILPARQASL